MIVCKASARFKRFTPAMFWMLDTLYAADLNKLDGQPDDLVITSANDSTHGPQSKHYADLALDLRSKTFTPAAKKVFRAALEAELGPKFRVLYEGAGTEQEHFHLQVRKGQVFP